MNGVGQVPPSRAAPRRPKPSSGPAARNSARILADVDSVVRSLRKSVAERREAVERIQKVSDIILGRKTRFSVDEATGKVVVAVIDPRTNAVIREIPSADEQRIRAKLRKAAEASARLGDLRARGSLLSVEA